MATMEDTMHKTLQNVEITENMYIDLKDGVRLSTRTWLPIGACKEKPVPAIFEFLPYRKRDVTTARDEITHQHFAKHGYAGVRVDMRGCGDSTGLVQDEYVLQEQEDALECIEWISKQDWCTGNVGMMGISWGGFNSLQVAARQPKALKAIIALSFTDDRYSDDIHFKGGAMLVDNILWAASMELRFSLPPDPLISDDWLNMWLNRMNNLQPLSELWLHHQTRDDYWKHGSICEDYSQIKAATFLIGGYADGYTNTVQRTLENIQCPKRAIIGPWVHLYPHIAAPSPLWGFCTEAVKWWDRWLKEEEMSDPPELVTYLQENVPVPCPDHVEGRWLQNPTSKMEAFYLKDGRLGQERGDSVITLSTSEICGRRAGCVFPVALSTMPEEQSDDDQMSCVFDTDPFTKTVEYVGYPVLKLSVKSDKRFSNLFIRLCAVDPEGKSRLFSYSAVNLNHDDSHETVTPLDLESFKDIEVKMDFIGESIQPGYKLRLAMSGAYFPMFVPNPEHTTFKLNLEKYQLDMPVLVSSEPLKERIPKITDCQRLPTIVRKPANYDQSNTVDDQGRLTIRKTTYSGEAELTAADGLVTEWTTEENFTIVGDDPSSAEVNVIQEVNWSRGEEWKVNVEHTINFTMDKDNFYTKEMRTAKHNGEIVFNKNYTNTVKRNGT